jgi:hypothetical protein
MSNATKASPVAGILRPHRLSKIDGRSTVGRRLRAITRELIEHCGGAGQISAAQRYLVERVAIDLIRLELLDDKMAAGTISIGEGRIAHALRNSVRLALREIGMKPAKAKTLTLQEHLSAIEAQAAPAPAAVGRQPIVGEKYL